MISDITNKFLLLSGCMMYIVDVRNANVSVWRCRTDNLYIDLN